MGVDPADLRPVVERLLGEPGARLGQWSVARLFDGDGQGAGVYRVSGEGTRSGARPQEWSVILKVLPSDGGTQDAWSYPEREALAYTSTLLEGLPGGVAAPRCFGHSRRGAVRLLWLEDLGPNDLRWALDDYAAAAHHLGTFNGAYLGERPLPDVSWLSRDWLRSLLAEAGPAVQRLPDHRNHPLVARVYPPDVLDGLMTLWSLREILLTALDRLPQVLCHNDAFRRNLFLGSGRLVAVDWAFVGTGPVGAELAPLVTASIAFLSVEHSRWDELHRVALDAYAAGLGEAGSDDVADQAAFGFTATSALRYGPGVVQLVLPRLLNQDLQQRTSKVLGLDFDAVVDHWAEFAARQVRLARAVLTADAVRSG